MEPNIKNIPQHLGQFLYEQIKELWHDAHLILDCENDNLLECKAHYQTADDTSEHPIIVTNEIVTLFKQVFKSATSINPKTERALFLPLIARPI